jgi:uncharacterized protein YecT (DUF1311 family)
MKYLALLLLFFVPKLVAPQCKDAVSTKDIQDCMDSEWKKADRELNRVYQESLKRAQTGASRLSQESATRLAHLPRRSVRSQL